MSGPEERLEMVAAGAASGMGESSGKAGTAGARDGAAVEMAAWGAGVWAS